MKRIKVPTGAHIDFLPVCSACRAILDDYVVNFEDNCTIPTAYEPLFTAKYLSCIIPKFCPHCKEKFDYIQLQTRLPFVGREK